MDLFDYKPRLNERRGQELPASVRGDQRLTGMTSGQKSFPVVPSLFKFSQHGPSGMWVSELLPQLGQVADELCFVRSMHTEAINHDPAVTYLQTGHQLAGRPSMGSLAQLRPGKREAKTCRRSSCCSRAAAPPDRTIRSTTRLWGSGFLPSKHQGVRFRSDGDPVLYLSNPPGVDGASRRRVLDALGDLNRKQADWSAIRKSERESPSTKWRSACRPPCPNWPT